MSINTPGAGRRRFTLDPILCFQSQKMIIELLLLSACVCTGLSYDEKDYGDTFRMRMLRKAESIEFSPMYSSDVTVLWKHDDPPAGEDSRRQVKIGYYVIYNLTQRDSGRYVMRDKYQKALSTKVLEVKANTRHYDRSTGESFSFNFSLEPKSCNIYFIQESEYEPTETQIVRRGRLQNALDELCPGSDLLRPCGISNEHLQYSCRGHFEVRDNNDDKALEAFLEIEPPPTSEFNPSHIGFGIGAFLSALSCCCCLRRCCCGKSSDEKDSPETPDAEPAVHYHEYDSEPGSGSHQLSQPSGTHYPTQPSYTPTDPLIHNPPPVNAPPAYSEVSAPAEQADAPTVPVHSDPELRFELKGMTFPSAPPLSSDSTYCEVYNSDKLNFL